MQHQAENDDQQQFEFQTINQIGSNEVGSANLLDQVFWQINQLSFDALEDVDFEYLSQNQIEKKVGNKLNIQKNEAASDMSSNLIDTNPLNLPSSAASKQNEEETTAQHSLPICIMSDVETLFRMKLS